MKKETLIIEGDLPTLNQYTKANRGNKFAGAKLKREATQLVELYAKSQITSKFKRIRLNITYFEKNKKRDKDNIAFAKKFILDGLVKAGVIENDGWKQIAGWTESFAVDKGRPRIEVVITEVELVKE